MENYEKYSFEEFKLMVNSAEKVTDRRLAMNKTNYSKNIGILLAIAIIWNWNISHNEYFFGGIVIIIIIIISSLAIFFCNLWIKQITDFKLLNTAKFQIINEISKNLKFES